jgi:hypothetical protein
MSEPKFIYVDGVRRRAVDADVLADITRMQKRIADLESQLAEKDKEIARMRPVVEAVRLVRRFHLIEIYDGKGLCPCQMCAVYREYENSKPEEKP